MSDEHPDLVAGTPEYAERLATVEAEIRLEKAAVLDAGGLFVLGTERHESRRIDNQLRGRSGRQGDPGLSRFYLSLDDDLLRIFGPDTLFARMMRSNIEDGEAIGSKWLSKAIETAQKKVEARNYDQRKNVVQYDDVMNDQRKVVYDQRADIMDSEAVGDVVLDMRHETVNALVGLHCPPNTYPEQWDVAALDEAVRSTLGLDVDVTEWVKEEAVDQEMFVDRLIAASDKAMADKAASVPHDSWIQIEKNFLLQALDHHWKEHLATLDALRQVIHLRAYAQKTPLNEYKSEAFALFERMLTTVREDVTRMLANARFEMQPEAYAPELPDFVTTHVDPLTGLSDAFGPVGNMPRAQLDIARSAAAAFSDIDEDTRTEWLATTSRNASCPCGSGKKFKHCHGTI